MKTRILSVRTKLHNLQGIFSARLSLFLPGTSIRYSITGGNRDGLFTIDQYTGVITLAAALDYDLHKKVRKTHPSPCKLVLNW